MTTEIWLLVHEVTKEDGHKFTYMFNPMFDGDLEDFMFNDKCRVIITFRDGPQPYYPETRATPWVKEQQQ